MNYFQGCKDVKEARKIYIGLAQKHHPDKGGDQKVMKEINHQFDEFKKHGKVYEKRSGFTYAGSTDHAYSAFWSQEFDFERMYEQMRNAGLFGSKARGKQAGPKESAFAKEHTGDWDEDFEAAANAKAQQDTEDLKERMHKLREEMERKKRQQEFEAHERKIREEAEKMYKLYKKISDNLNMLLTDKIDARNFSFSDFKRQFIILTPEDIKKAVESL